MPDTPKDDYFAMAGGLEYTINRVAGSDADLGLLAEYLYDGRENSLETSFQNDLFVGLRVGFNDQQSSEVLAGVVVDLEQDGLVWRVEASRRLGQDWKAELTLQGFPRTVPGEPNHYWRKDGYLRLQLVRYF